MYLVLVLFMVVTFVVLATSRYKLHPFITLLLAAFATALLAGMPPGQIAKTISAGFGGILGSIGIVIILGTLIGTILEKTGAAITMADTIIGLLGSRFPKLTMSIIGYIVSIPVFCDSGYVILNSLKRSLGKRLKASAVGMSVALATGLYATHTFVPPTPGPIAAAGNLGLADNLGLLIILGLIVAAATSLAGLLWAHYVSDRLVCGEDSLEEENLDDLRASYGELPSPLRAFAPILVPILLICLGTVANYPTHPFGTEDIQAMFLFLGTPLNALMIGLGIAVTLIRGEKRIEQFSTLISKGVLACAPILLITGAGGAFGKVLAATDIGPFLGQALSGMGIGILMPFAVAAAIKTAQGSSTVALVTASALLAPLLGDIGLATEMGRVLTVLAIGAGAMTVCHANDSYFWVVSQFSEMSVGTAYRAQTLATLIQGITGITVVYIMSVVLL